MSNYVHQTFDDHAWKLVEEGYSRVWHVSFEGDGSVRAYDDTLTDEGDGRLFLECFCGATFDINPDIAKDIHWD